MQNRFKVQVCVNLGRTVNAESRAWKTIAVCEARTTAEVVMKQSTKQYRGTILRIAPETRAERAAACPAPFDMI